MNPATRTASLSARFWAGLLITGQLACGLPAQASDTLRTGQEAETRSAGLEKTLATGLEEAIPLTMGPEETARFRALAGAISGSQFAEEDPLDFSMIDGLLREHSLKGTPLFDNGIVRVTVAPVRPLPGEKSEPSRSLVTSFEPEAWDPEELGVLGILPSKKSEPTPVEMGDYFVDEFGFSYRKSKPEGVVVRFRNLNQAAGLTGINPQLELSLRQDEKGRLFLAIRGTSEDLPGKVPAFLAAAAFFAKKGVSLAASERPVPLQIGRLDGAGDVASGPTSQKLFVTRGRDILEFDGTTGTRVNLFENIFLDSFDLYRQRLQFDEKRGLLFALERVKSSTYAIYRIRVNAPPGQGIELLATATSDDSRVYSPDLAYDPEDETVILMTESGFSLLDARTGKVKSEVHIPLTRPAVMAYDPRNKTIYLADQNPDDSKRYWITAYNRNGQATGLKIPFKDIPVDMTLDASQQKLFLIGQGYTDRPKLQQYNLATGSWADPIKERLTDPLRAVPFAGGEVLWILDGGWLRPFSMGTGDSITSPTIRSVFAASALLHSDGVFTGGLGREAQGILRTLLERQEITEVYVDQEQLPLSPNAIDTIGEIGVRILREERRFERTGTVLKVTIASSIAPSAGLEEDATILLVGSDEDEIGRVQGIAEEVFPGADIQRLPLPLPPNISFRGVDIAILVEFDEEAKETLVQALQQGRISHVIAAEHEQEQLKEYPLREALERFRNTAGLEENWPEKMKEILRPVWGERSDQLTLQDLMTLRSAGSTEALTQLLYVYGAALGFENLPLGYFSTTATRLFAEGWLYPEPMNPPSPELFIAYAERIPSSIGNEFYWAVRAQTAEEFREKVAQAQRAIEEYLRNAPEDDFWRLRLSPLVEAEYTDREKELLLQTAQRIVAALFLGEAATNREDRARTWVAKTRPPHLKEVLDQLEQLGIPFSPETNGSYKRSFMALASFIIRYPTSASRGGAKRITVSRSQSRNEPVFVGNATHELTHWGISQLPELVERADPSPTSEEDWFTASAESILTRWVAEETKTPPLYPAAAIGPALVEWLHRRGTEIARKPTDKWVLKILGILAYFPPGLVHYVVGRIIGGIAEQLGQEAATAVPALNRHEAALSFILGALIREGQGPFDLKNLGPAARKFRATHNLPEEYSTAGLEELVLGERLDGLRSAAQGDAAVVIGPSVSKQFGGLEELARLDGGRRIFLDQGADTALHMLEAGIKEARYYGGLEEAGVFQRMVAGAVSVSRHAPTEGPFLAQVEAVLRLVGVPEPMIRAGLEEFTDQLDAVDIGA